MGTYNYKLNEDENVSNNITYTKNYVNWKVNN